MKKVALITGASRGIGAATALKLAAGGYSICVNYKSNHDAANAVLKQIHQVEQFKDSGCHAMAIAADVSVESEVVDLFKRIDAEFGTITALVNNVGILMTQMRVEQMTAERINQILTTNVTSYFLCCREAVKRMANKNGGNGGAIVNVSSAASRTGSPGEYTDYAASKGAVDTLTTGLSVEVAAQGIRVNCVRPGCIYTDMHADGGEPGRVDRVKYKLPMQRGGQPSEVANAIAWLLSDEASYVTGSFLDLSGGC